MASPRPTPTNLKLLRGNPGRRPLPENEPIVPEGEIVCPDWLSSEAKVIFADYQTILTSMNVLTVADVRMLAILAATEAEFIECDRDVQENGSRFEVLEGSKWVANPAVPMRSDAGKRVKALQVEFGLSPSSRTRVKTQKPVEVDPLAELMARRNG